MPECISISIAPSSLPVCVHPHALLWYIKHPIHIGPSAHYTPRQYQRLPDTRCFASTRRMLTVSAKVLVPALLCQQSSGAGPPVSAKLADTRGFAGTRRMLTPEACWYQRLTDIRGFAGTRRVLTPEACWYQRLADTRTLLAPGLCWHQDFAGTRTLLAPELC
jgi:hypothetical protein